MRWTTALALVLVIGLGATTVGLAQKGKPNPDVPVVAVINDSDPDVAATLQILSDGAPYAPSSTLGSVITGPGVWTLRTLESATRMVSLQFTNPIPGSGPNGGDPVAPASGLYKAWIYSSCNHFGNNPLTMVPAQTVSCPMAVVFYVNNQEHIIHMTAGPEHPLTEPVNFTCLAGSSGSSTCGQWRITPSGTVVTPEGAIDLRNVAELSIRTRSRGQTIVTRQGRFYLSFSIELTKQ